MPKQLPDMTQDERAALIRNLLSSQGWGLWQPTLDNKIEQVQDQFLLDDTPGSERHPDFKNWSHEKLAGMALGLRWSSRFLPLWLAQYDQAQRAALEQPPIEESGTGHPYADQANSVPTA